jgi:hypothetical protein
MALFPEYGAIQYLPGVEIIPRYNTAVSSLPGGTEKRRAKFAYPLYDLNVSYDLLTLAEARTIWQFYKDRQGAYESFYFYLPYPDTYEGEYCGTGDGSTTVFEIPAKDINANPVVYKGGVGQSIGSDYNMDYSGGIEGGAQIEFVAAPSIGDHIIVDFTGYYRFKVRFADDDLSFTVFYQTLTKMGISLVGVR